MGVSRDPAVHKAVAGEHEKLGRLLVETEQDWGAVCLFYAAYRQARSVILADPVFDSEQSCMRVHADLRPQDRFATRHKGRKNQSGYMEFGVNDLVFRLYGKAASKDYEALHQASIQVRYEQGLPPGGLVGSLRAYDSWKAQLPGLSSAVH